MEQKWPHAVQMDRCECTQLIESDNRHRMWFNRYVYIECRIINTYLLFSDRPHRPHKIQLPQYRLRPAAAAAVVANY